MQITLNKTTTLIIHDDLDIIITKIKLMLEMEGYHRDTIEDFFIQEDETYIDRSALDEILEDHAKTNNDLRLQLAKSSDIREALAAKGLKTAGVNKELRKRINKLNLTIRKLKADGTT